MKIIEIIKNLYLYQFPPAPGKAFGFNLYAFIDGEDVLLLDTAYEAQGQQAAADLGSKGLRVKNILLSHSHEDHINGTRAFPGVEVWGSPHISADSLSELGITEFKPLDVDAEVVFGAFRFRFKSAPGHSVCSLYTIINEDIIHAGDKLIATNGGEAILPFVYDGARHMDSLRFLRELSPDTLLLGHGAPIVGKEKIRLEIERRLAYIEAVWGAEGEISYAEVALRAGEFECPSWHEHNQKMARGGS